MGLHQYIGARYVPRFLGTYDATTIYEAMDVVDNGSGTSYVAKIPTPAGTPLTDSDHWAVYGAASGAIISLQNQINDMQDPSVAGSLQEQIVELQNINDDQTYLLINFPGATPEDKLFNALDTITYGTIVLNMDVDIYNTHDLQASGWKDYRRIFIANGNINLHANYMFDNGSPSLPSYAAPCFVNCNITSDNKTIYKNSYNPGTPSSDKSQFWPWVIGIKFVNCYIYKTIIFENSQNYLQSPHAINCEFRECDHVIRCKGFTDLRFISNQFERTTNHIVETNTGELGTLPTDATYYTCAHALISDNVIEYTGDTMFIFGKSTDIQILGNYFEDNIKPYYRPTDQTDVVSICNNFFNEFDPSAAVKFCFQFGTARPIKLIISGNETMTLFEGIKLVEPDVTGDNECSIKGITASGTPQTIQLEKNSMYLLAWTRNGGTDYYLEFISMWTLAVAITHVVNTSTYITTSIDSNGVLTITTTSTGQFRLLKL